MLRVAILSIVLTVCANGFTLIWQSRHFLPRCCTKHGCTMMKSAVNQCAFASCDREDSDTGLKMPRAIACEGIIGAVPQIESPIVTRAIALILPQGVTDIDHPPRLLPA